MSCVYFIGAGPYDSSYITKKGWDVLQEADCILYDHLLDEELLAQCQGEKIYVGKQAGKHSMPQEEINALLVAKAKVYEKVVRLKGGDSFVFGRGGEEAMCLHEARIPFFFIPGITSAVAVAEMAGIPVTYRGVATGFQVMSAHLQDHTLVIDPYQVKNPKITLIFLMGLSRVAQICDVLLQAGRNPQTPIAVISQGASPMQQVVTSTLADMPQELVKHTLVSPAIIVVGDVVHLRSKLRFFEHQPLFGKHILVCKLHTESSPLSKLLRSQGAYVEEAQVGEIQYRSLANYEQYHAQSDGIIFTSQHAVHALWKHLQEQQLDARIFYGKQVYVIGRKTAQVLQSYGIRADMVCNGSHEDLEKNLQSKAFKQRLLYVKGAMAKSFVWEDVAAIQEIIAYDNCNIVPVIKEKAYDAICFSSASAVQRLPIELAEQTCVSIGKTTSAALRQRGVQRIIEAASPTYEAMCEALCKEEITCIVEED